MVRTKGDITKLVSAKTESDSLRVTMPSSLVKVLKLKAGDELCWELDNYEKGIVKVTIQKTVCFISHLYYPLVRKTDRLSLLNYLSERVVYKLGSLSLLAAILLSMPF